VSFVSPRPYASASGLPGSADIVRGGGHVSNVRKGAMHVEPLTSQAPDVGAKVAMPPARGTHPGKRYASKSIGSRFYSGFMFMISSDLSAASAS